MAARRPSRNKEPGEGGPLYAIESLIFGDEGRFSYIVRLPSLGSQSKVLLDKAREFPEYAPADPVDKAIVVGSGEQPTLTRYTLSNAGEWSEGETISFAKYTSAPLEASVYTGENKAYVPFDGTNHMTWSPADFTLGVEVGAPPEIPLTRGDAGELSVHRGFDHGLRDGKLMQPYYFADEAFHTYSPISQVSVIDLSTDKVEAVRDVPCPHLHLATEDEAGNIYFSNGQGSIAAAVLNPAHPRNCFVRSSAGSTTLDEGSVVYFKDLTDGREGSNLLHVSGNLAIFNVYHAELDTITPETEFSAVNFSAHYHLWTLDLSTMKAAMMEGIDYSGGQVTAQRIDNTTYVSIPDASYSTTAVYKVSASGVAEKLFDVQGWAFKMFRVR